MGDDLSLPDKAAVRRRSERDKLAELTAEYEATHGALMRGEIDAARALLRVGQPAPPVDETSRTRATLGYLAEFERQHGAFTEEEKRRAAEMWSRAEDRERSWRVADRPSE
jgi:hypothetical protein